MYLLSGQGTVCVEKARLDVLWLEEGILTEYGLGGIARRQHLQYVLDGETHVADDRFAAENVGANGDAIEQIGFLTHDVSLHSSLHRGDLTRSYQAATPNVSVRPDGSCPFGDH